MEWNELSRAEKIAHLFDYPYDERGEKVRELWGKDASEYVERVCFPYGTPWHEMVTVLKMTGKSQKIYVRLTIDDTYAVSVEDMERNEDAATAMLGWRKELYTDAQKVLLYVSKFDETRLLGSVCIDEGYRGDSDGYGVEPSVWVCALYDYDGRIVAPFKPGSKYPVDD